MQEETILKTVLGIDVSKSKFDVCLMTLSTTQTSKIKGTRQFENTEKGIKQLQEWLFKKRIEANTLHVLMEATGIYYERLAYELYHQEFKVYVVLPNKAKRYMESLGLKSKNDKIDAKGLALMCAQQQHDCWEPMQESYYALRGVTRQMASLQKYRVGLMNQLHALRLGMFVQQELIDQLSILIAGIETQLKGLEARIATIVSSDEHLQTQLTRITAVKGLSLVSVATIIAETNGFKLFKNQRQLVSYAGYDVVENSSGNHVGKTKISKKGNSHIRRILHMPSLTTVRCKEPHFTALFDRVHQRTGIKKKGYVAVQKKLLVLIYTLWKNESSYDENYNVKKQAIAEKEQKSLLSFDFEKVTKKVGELGPPTQDELSHEKSQKALLSLLQI